MISHRLTFITPLFSKGVYDRRPEIRPPSIRGQLRWWFRALDGSFAEEKAIFGGVHQGATASKVVVRVANIAPPSVKDPWKDESTLPHKQLPCKCKGPCKCKPFAAKPAYKAGTSFELGISFRLGGLDDKARRMFDRALETWLLLGTLGLRATRAAGSFSWQPLNDAAFAMPSTLDAWRTRCEELLKGAPLKFHIIEKPFDNAEEARKIVSDTIGGRNDPFGYDLQKIRYPLGQVIRSERKTSSLRFRLIPVAGRFHIAAVWDNRENVTHNTMDDLHAVISLLCQKNKPIGELLKAAEWLPS